MPKIKQKTIEIPAGVEVKIDNKKVVIKGVKGELSYEIRPEIKVEQKENKILISPQIDTKQTKAFFGLTIALLNNMLKGVVNGFQKQLEIQGVGYKAELQGKDIVMQIGFSHPVNIPAPENIEFSVEKNIITVTGFDKQLVGNTAAKIRKIRPPEPYKGKGIRWVGEIVRKKVGKKAVASE